MPFCASRMTGLTYALSRGHGLSWLGMPYWLNHSEPKDPTRTGDYDMPYHSSSMSRREPFNPKHDFIRVHCIVGRLGLFLCGFIFGFKAFFRWFAVLILYWFNHEDLALFVAMFPAPRQALCPKPSLSHTDPTTEASATCEPELPAI
ncbi:hypothetical protein GW17_00035711 [Ensete ventricosum]|nr:hypothetical protein GW17_00035711 [Ensete ventricosum]